MKSFNYLSVYLINYKLKLSLCVLFNILTALFTLISIPFIIPFFQILFDVNISSYEPPENFRNLEHNLNYFFSRLIAISDRPTALSLVCIAMTILVLLRNVFRYLTSVFLIPVRNGLVRDLRMDLMQSFSSMSISYADRQNKGDLLSIVSNDVTEVEWSVIRMLELLFKSPLIIAGSLIFMFWLNVKLSVIALSLMIVIAFLMGALSRDLKVKSKNTQESLGLLNAKLHDLISGLRIIKAYGAQQFFKNEFEKENNYHYTLNNRILWRRDLASPLSEILGVSLAIVLIFYGAKMVLASQMSPESFFAFIFAFYNVIEPSKTLSSAWYNIQKGLASMDRIATVLQSNRTKILKSGESILNPEWSQIEFKDVGFKYDERLVLNELNLTIENGKSIAIVGRSGAGKTSLLELLMRFYDPMSGAIELDGQNIADFNIDRYRNMYGLVTQDTFLFNMSVEKNIVLGRNISNNALLAAIEKGNARNFIDLKENKLQAESGDGGLRFSAGERQRLTIARAIAEERPILIIDEATTSLDAESEHDVLMAIENAMKGRATIIISHKFNLIKNVDKIYVIDGGRIVESGSHADLQAKESLYKELLSFHLCTNK